MLGFDVYLIGVPGFSYKERSLPAWRCDPPWFDGWELANDPRMIGEGMPSVGLFFAEEVRQMHARFSKRVRADGTTTPTPMDMKIISDDDWSSVMPDIPPPPTVAEVDQLLADPRLGWVVIVLWDRS